MKSRILFIMLLTLVGRLVTAQETMRYDKDRNYYLFGVGYHLTGIQNPGLNYVIDRYNETRQGQSGAARLTRNMDYLNNPGGFAFGMFLLDNKYLNGYFFDLNAAFLKSKARAEGVDVNQNPASRDLEFRTGNYSLDFGFMFYQSPFIDLGVGMGTSVQWGKIKTRAGDADFEDAQDIITAGFEFFPQINFFLTKTAPVSLSVRPYYCIDLIKTDFNDLNEFINPYTALNDPTEDQKGRFSHLGAQVRLNLMIRGAKQEGARNIEGKHKTKRGTQGFE